MPVATHPCPYAVPYRGYWLWVVWERGVQMGLDMGPEPLPSEHDRPPSAWKGPKSLPRTYKVHRDHGEFS